MRKLEEEVYKENKVTDFSGKDIDLAFSHDFEGAERMRIRERQIENERRFGEITKPYEKVMLGEWIHYPSK